MPIERAGSAPVHGIAPRADGVTVSRLTGYPVNAFLIEGGDAAALADAVTAAALALQGANVPHNMLIADCGRKVYLTPQCYADKQAKGLVPEHLLDTGERVTLLVTRVIRVSRIYRVARRHDSCA